MKKQSSGIIAWCIILFVSLYLTNIVIDFINPEETYTYQLFREELEEGNIKQAALQQYDPVPTGKLIVLLTNGEEYSMFIVDSFHPSFFF